MKFRYVVFFLAVSGCSVHTAEDDTTTSPGGTDTYAELQSNYDRLLAEHRTKLAEIKRLSAALAELQARNDALTKQLAAQRGSSSSSEAPATSESKPKERAAQPRQQVQTPKVTTTTREPGTSRKWYEGGTLHRKSALDWQKATGANKLATCADLVAALHKNGSLKTSMSNRIKSIDDLLPYAIELRSFLDAAFERDPDDQINRRMYANQTVSSATAIAVVMLKWNE